MRSILKPRSAGVRHTISGHLTAFDQCQSGVWWAQPESEEGLAAHWEEGAIIGENCQHEGRSDSDDPHLARVGEAGIPAFGSRPFDHHIEFGTACRGLWREPGEGPSITRAPSR
jgi:hypothetical protein